MLQRTHIVQDVSKTQTKDSPGKSTGTGRLICYRTHQSLYWAACASTRRTSNTQYLVVIGQSTSLSKSLHGYQSSNTLRNVQPQEMPLGIFFTNVSVQLHQGVGRNVLQCPHHLRFHDQLKVAKYQDPLFLVSGANFFIQLNHNTSKNKSSNN